MAPSGVTSADPLLVVAQGLNQPDDLLYANGLLYVGEYGSGRIAVIGPAAQLTTLPVLVPEVEGMALIDGTLYAADQKSDTVVAIAGATAAPVLRLTPVSGQEGVDGISAQEGNLVVPDSPRGRILVTTTHGQILRTIGGFDRPTGIWPLANGGLLVADEYAGRIDLVPAAGGAITSLAEGIPLADDVAETPAATVLAISLTDGALLQVAPGSPTVLARGLNQPQGLTLDGAGNALIAESGAGRVDEVVTTFQPLPAQGVVSLSSGQPLCIGLLRSPTFGAGVDISPSSAFRTLSQPGTGRLGEILPRPCHTVCRLQVQLVTGSLIEGLTIAYRAA